MDFSTAGPSIGHRTIVKMPGLGLYYAGPSKGHKTIINMPGLSLYYAWASLLLDPPKGGGGMLYKRGAAKSGASSFCLSAD